MAFKKKIEFANFTCTFGDKFVLLDLFDDVIRPAFIPGRHVIGGLGNQLFIVDAGIFVARTIGGEKYHCLSGRLVRKTIVSRDQVYERGVGIVPDHQEMDSAPTSIFFLILENHRLIYVKETAGAPTITQFEKVAASFISRRHKEFLREKAVDGVDFNLDARQRTRLISENISVISHEFPYPDIRVTPLTDSEGIEDFVSRFEHIDSLTIRLLKTNDEEIDLDGFWKSADAQRRAVGGKSNTMSISYRNTKDGLHSEKVIEQCVDATVLANSDVTLNGKDKQGDVLRGSNEDFKLTQEEASDGISKDPSEATRQVVERFQALVAVGLIVVPAFLDKQADSIKKIFSSNS